MTRHFLSDDDLSKSEYLSLMQRAIELKTELKAGKRPDLLKNKVLAMIFTKASTRTRTSFETGMAQMGGHAINLTPHDTQLGRGEPLADTAHILNQMADAIMIRNDSQTDQQIVADVCEIPVINGLSDYLHPCQMLADIQTLIEQRGNLEGMRIAWIGDGNNVCHSWIKVADKLGLQLNIGCPEGYLPDAALLRAAGQSVSIHHDAFAAAKDADVIVTDVWSSMGQEQESANRLAAFSSFCVDDTLMAQANRDALFMHCLPAHRGEEVSASVIDGAQSVVWQQGGNRLHAQKALLEFLMS